MEIFKTVKEIQTYLRHCNVFDIGFVPTMGALHQGHLSLIAQSKKQNKITICSIFVNPKQFNNQDDLIKYPRNTEKDLQLLKKNNCDVVFIPNEKEIYPKEQDKKFYFGILSEVMEAAHRPGHFNGVALVIERFFEILHPKNAYFGEKDFQQLAVIRNLVKQLKLDVNIVGCPICRAENGLAMSSRNERLTAKEKQEAARINKALNFIKGNYQNYNITTIKKKFEEKINTNNLLNLEYFEIADGNSLASINKWEETDYCVAFTAVNVGSVRLIDNITIFN